MLGASPTSRSAAGTWSRSSLARSSLCGKSSSFWSNSPSSSKTSPSMPQESKWKQRMPPSATQNLKAGIAILSPQNPQMKRAGCPAVVVGRNAVVGRDVLECELLFDLLDAVHRPWPAVPFEQIIEARAHARSSRRGRCEFVVRHGRLHAGRARGCCDAAPVRDFALVWASIGRWNYRDESARRCRERRFAENFTNGSDGTRTRDLRRDRPAF